MNTSSSLRKLKRLSAIVFDFDGVLADSVEVKTAAFANLYKEYGDKVVEKVIHHHRNHGGMTRAEKFYHYHSQYAKHPLTDEDHEALCQRFSSLVVEKVTAAKEIAGAETMLRHWHGKVPLFIDSATPDEEIILITQKRGIAKYFEKTLGSGHSKTENLKAILEGYDLAPEEVVFYGDAASDYRAATNCGTHFVGILPNANAPLLSKAPNIEWYPDLIAANKALVTLIKG